MSQAYGNNLIKIGSKYCLISGDVNQEGVIDISDFAIIDNDIYSFKSGTFIASDVNGDKIVDLNDMQIVDNNRSISVILP